MGDGTNLLYYNNSNIHITYLWYKSFSFINTSIYQNYELRHHWEIIKIIY